MKMKLMFLIIFIVFNFSSIAGGNWSVEIDQEFFALNPNLSLYDIWSENYSDLIEEVREDINGDIYYHSEIVVYNDKLEIFAGLSRYFEKKINLDEQTVMFLIENNTEENKFSKNKYNLQAETLRQQVSSFFLGAQLLPDSFQSLDLVLKGALLSGIELKKRDYLGRIEVERGSLKGVEWINRKRVNSSLGEEAILGESDFHSWGYSLSGALFWNIKPGFNLKFKADNFLSLVKWFDVYTHKDQHIDFKDYTTSLTTRLNFELKKSDFIGGIVCYNYRNFHPYLKYILIDKAVEVKTGFYDNFFTLNLTYKGVGVDIKTKEINLFTSSGIHAGVNINFSF